MGGKRSLTGAGPMVQREVALWFLATAGPGALVVRDTASGKAVVEVPARGIDANR